MTQLLPSTTNRQPTRTAVKLALKDELRTLSFNLQQGAHWLLQDLAPSIAHRMEPTSSPAQLQIPLQKLHQLFDSTAQVTLSTLEAAQQAAVTTVLQDSTYREAKFQLEPLAAYFSHDGERSPSKLFTNVFYWLIRHAIEAHPPAPLPQPHLITRQQAVDQAYWLVLEKHPALVARVRTAALAKVHDARDHAALCAAVLQALVTVHPVRDAILPPWAEQSLSGIDGDPALASLITAVVAVGLLTDASAPPADAAAQLATAGQLVAARLPALEAALVAPTLQRAGDALAAEFAFLFRHA